MLKDLEGSSLGMKGSVETARDREREKKKELKQASRAERGCGRSCPCLLHARHPAVTYS